jgi:hypothetical protein
MPLEMVARRGGGGRSGALWCQARRDLLSGFCVPSPQSAVDQAAGNGSRHIEQCTGTDFSIDLRRPVSASDRSGVGLEPDASRPYTFRLRDGTYVPLTGWDVLVRPDRLECHQSSVGVRTPRADRPVVRSLQQRAYVPRGLCRHGSYGCGVRGQRSLPA